MRLFFERSDERAGARQCFVEIIHAEEQQQAVAGLCMIGAGQGRMLVRSPLVEAEQDRAIRVEDLPEIVVGRSRLRQAQ